MKKISASLLAALLVGAAGSAYGSSAYFSQFTYMYPGSQTSSFGCLVCHQGAPPALNRYGADFANNAHNFEAIEPLDSDGDGYSNRAEIDAGTNPGDPSSHPAELLPAMAVPTGPQVVTFTPVTSPVIDANPILAKPIGVGAIATGGNTFGVLVGLDRFPTPVDVYLLLYMPKVDPSHIYTLTQSGLQMFAPGAPVPWISGSAAPLNASLLYGVPTSGLSSGPYTLGILATPPGTLNAYYLWATTFVIP